MAYEASADDSWALYAQEQPEQRDPAQYQHHQPVYSLPAPDKAYLANSALDVTDGRSGAGVAPEELYGYATTAEGYAAPAYTFAPQRTASYGTTPSPGLPALSPSSATSFSSSSFSSTVSPLHHGSAATTPELQRSAGLLPPARIDGGGGEYASQQDVRDGGFFASAQDSYMQQQQCVQYEGQAAQYPPSSSAFVLPPAAPSTPRRHPPASHLYRSPSAYSVASTPTTSPYHRPSTPRSAVARRRSVDGLAESPTKRASPRKVQAVTTSVDANGTPTKTVRRVARLSIEVPPAAQRGIAPLSAPPNSLPSPAWSTAPPPLPPPPSFTVQSEPIASSSASSPADQVLSEAAVREVEQLLGELGPILETGVYEQPGGANDESYIQLSPRAQARMPGGSYAQDGRAPPMSISISGVTLGEEDLALLEDPSLTSDVYDSPSRSYPASASAWRTTFDLPPAPPPPVPPFPHAHYTSYNDQYLSPTKPVSTYTLSHSSSMNSLALPPNPHQRAYSAQGHLPRSVSSQDPFLSSSPPRASSSVLRRRSSVDSVNLAASYGRHPYPPPLPQQQQPPQQPFPAVLQPAPPQGVARPSTPPPKPAQANSKSPSKTTPKRKRGSPTKTKQPAAMFINYSSQDAKKLLSGVAPSGSSKKKREEDEARQRALEEAQARGYAAGIASASPVSVAASRSSSSGSAVQ
ncbi:hypothetical protein NBRC10512_001014 [Rhodotorula toruloides]|uniref:RHTO0S06e09428g1_1 n=2 Tax=Rhodotorula toruloides TaxID=5286 RepID=A0A061AX11_RHOTO|nr:uncharacterized protein RHTO_04464 [Rhodotorula toruloides NP11]EMS19463.1 hypothetical protein RHTO_04464 [Rhodotorula toruloides NP11]KAJ8293539.1 Developmental regulatory protein wetA [Rhodotorula toruloides]CDR42069.1 RHTO0S06e09428g1_1 [Rhodotorula toruloides]